MTLHRPLVSLAVACALLQSARAYNSLPDDVYAYPKYSIGFLNGLPLPNVTAQYWLAHGLKGGEKEFLEQAWDQDSHGTSRPQITGGETINSDVRTHPRISNARPRISVANSLTNYPFNHRDLWARTQHHTGSNTCVWAPERNISVLSHPQTKAGHRMKTQLHPRRTLAKLGIYCSPCRENAFTWVTLLSRCRDRLLTPRPVQ